MSSSLLNCKETEKYDKAYMGYVVFSNTHLFITNAKIK